MTEAALMNFEFGFESTVLPFDLNVEAEILGAEVQYHDAVDGNPIYPTVGDKPFSMNDEIEIPDDLPQKGRMPVILKSIRAVKEDPRATGPLAFSCPVRLRWPYRWLFTPQLHKKDGKKAKKPCRH